MTAIYRFFGPFLDMFVQFASHLTSGQQKLAVVIFAILSIVVGIIQFFLNEEESGMMFILQIMRFVYDFFIGFYIITLFKDGVWVAGTVPTLSFILCLILLAVYIILCTVSKCFLLILNWLTNALAYITVVVMVRPNNGLWFVIFIAPFIGYFIGHFILDTVDTLGAPTVASSASLKTKEEVKTDIARRIEQGTLTEKQKELMDKNLFRILKESVEENKDFLYKYVYDSYSQIMSDKAKGVDVSVKENGKAVKKPSERALEEGTAIYRRKIYDLVKKSGNNYFGVNVPESKDMSFVKTGTMGDVYFSIVKSFGCDGMNSRYDEITQLEKTLLIETENKLSEQMTNIGKEIAEEFCYFRAKTIITTVMGEDGGVFAEETVSEFHQSWKKPEYVDLFMEFVIRRNRLAFMATLANMFNLKKPDEKTFPKDGTIGDAYRQIALAAGIEPNDSHAKELEEFELTCIERAEKALRDSLNESMDS